MNHFARISAQTGKLDLLVALSNHSVSGGALGRTIGDSFVADPAWPGKFVDVTALSPDLPKDGSFFNAKDGSFSPPAPPPKQVRTALKQAKSK